MTHDKQTRCIHVDWLEVYCLEHTDYYPLDADYFRRKGYLVKEREYGTRVYNQMFEILDNNLNPIMEVRREPASGDSSFSGLVPESCHLRLPNWVLYQGNPVRTMMEFLVQHNYIFKRIFRLDIALDFEYFDSGDKPSDFVRRYLQGKYRKINQCNLTAHGEDNWKIHSWNSLSWGARTSMISTKLYNKTKELEEGKTKKPYIRTAWLESHLIDNPITCEKMKEDGKLHKVDIWRLEFSMKSSLNGYIDYEMQNRKRVEKQRIPHTLSSYDTKDKLWQRYQDLVYHYFRFKHAEYVDLTQVTHGGVLESVHSHYEKPLKRKDRCRDKRLFYFDNEHEFLTLSQCPPDAKRNREDDVLERRLKMYRDQHIEHNIRHACDIILQNIDLHKLVDYSPEHLTKEARALQITLARKLDGDVRDAAEILNEIKKLIEEDKLY